MEDLYFFVDRLEDGVATIIVSVGEGELHIPAYALPEGAGEGDFLRVTLAVDEARKAAERDEIDRLYGELGDNP